VDAGDVGGAARSTWARTASSSLGFAQGGADLLIFSASWSTRTPMARVRRRSSARSARNSRTIRQPATIIVRNPAIWIAKEAPMMTAMS
jgi:hypothetical protein